jgi:curved DNA-binding protein CbpA
MSTHYATLGLSAPYHRHSAADIKRAYQAALLKNHPDKAIDLNDAVFNFRPSIDKIRASYAVVGDPALRAAHDRDLALAEHNRAIARAHADAQYAAAERVCVDDLPFDPESRCWLRECRCGEIALVSLEEVDTEADQDGDELIVACDGCSLWTRVEFGPSESGDGGGSGGSGEDDMDVDVKVEEHSAEDDSEDELDEVDLMWYGMI